MLDEDTKRSRNIKRIRKKNSCKESLWEIKINVTDWRTRKNEEINICD